MAFFTPSNPPMSDWQGKRVWVVGASSGIGEATASALHARGAQVIVSARNQQALQRFADQHHGAQPLVLDATDRRAILAAAHSVMAQGRLDCVVYCAGYYNPMRAQTLDLDDALRHTEVNFTAALYLLDALLKPLLAQGNAHISLVGSVAGYRGLPNSLAYGASKAALIHLAETLYLDLKATSIGVSVINPGFVETPLTAKNDFNMPALMRPADAAQAILKGWAAGLFEIHFPKRFTLWLKLMRLLPYRTYFALVARATS
jgi:NAD(P)-dependent dehydrogenase (short-subunit alcohol dehydrogenase family)